MSKCTSQVSQGLKTFMLHQNLLTNSSNGCAYSASFKFTASPRDWCLSLFQNERVQWDTAGERSRCRPRGLYTSVWAPWGQWKVVKISRQRHYTIRYTILGGWWKIDWQLARWEARKPLEMSYLRDAAVLN